MANNPFRRPTSTTAESSLQRDITPPPRKSQTAKKRVKILTPPHSPEDVPRRLSTGTTSPPPPQSPDDQDDTDSTATADSELEEAERNTRRNSGSLPPPSGAATPNVKAPYNPFARTLATQEAAFGVQHQNGTQRDAEQRNEEGDSKGTDGTAGLHVDEFKNILLTGSAPPSQAVSAWSQRLQDNGSSTDASSVSRQSLFDAAQETHSGTSASSFDRMEFLESPSENSEDENDSRLVNRADHLDDAAAPSLPKRSAVSKGPQIVSFDDFRDSSFSKPARKATSSTTMAPDTVEEENFQRRSPNDLNKAFASPPVISTAAQNSSTSKVSEINRGPSPRSNQSTGPPSVTTEQKKAPPPPPAARRTAPERRRSDSNPNRNNESTRGEESTLPLKPVEVPVKSSPPPPPPSRKTRPLSQTGPASSTTASEAPSPAPPATDAKSVRPPPPPRSATRPESISNRESLITSRPPLPRNETSPASQNAPPAPPPRRSVANSARNSIDGRPPSISGRRRSSEYSSNTERSASLPSLQNVAESVETVRDVPAPADSAGARDILADMSAFQAEIDAMRARAGGAG